VEHFHTLIKIQNFNLKKNNIKTKHIIAFTRNTTTIYKRINYFPGNKKAMFHVEHFSCINKDSKILI